MDKNKATLKMSVKEDVILLNGVFSTDKSATSEFILSGPGTSRWIQKPMCKILLGNITVANKHVLQIKAKHLELFLKDVPFKLVKVLNCIARKWW
ncbi:MAG: hypothetical protein IPO63_11685 [Bacteroidetes bacterium]|nr:hypothetical protein [Bacteroidota bacterium]